MSNSHLRARATIVAQASNFLVKTRAAMMPGDPAMASLSNEELIINTGSQATKWQYISIKCTTIEI